MKCVFVRMYHVFVPCKCSIDWVRCALCLCVSVSHSVLVFYVEISTQFSLHQIPSCVYVFLHTYM